MATNQGFKSFVPNPKKLNPKFLYHWLRANRQYLEGLGNGATFKEVSKTVIARLEIPLPPIVEQGRIASILDRADALRSKRRDVLAKLVPLTQSIFIEMFGDPHESSDFQTLSEHLAFITSGGRGWAKYYSPEGDRFIRSFDVKMNHIANEDSIFVNAPNNAEARRTHVEAGDVLLTITGSRIGRVASVPADFGPAYISQHVAILRLRPEKVLPDFLSFYLSLPSGGQRQIAKAQYGQTKPGLNFEQIGSFKIPVPPIDRQYEFCRRIVKVSDLHKQLNQSLSGLEALFSSIRDRAFRGEL